MSSAPRRFRIRRRGGAPMERSSIDQSPSMLSEVQRRSDMLVRTLPIALLPIFAGLISGLLIRFFLGTNQRHAAIASHRGAELLAGLVVAVVLCTALIILVRLGRPTISALLF